MFSQRGVLNLFHSARGATPSRRGNAMRLHGVDAELLDRDEVRRWHPSSNFDNARFPILGGLLQPAGARCGTMRWRGDMRAPPTRTASNHLSNAR